jgi:phenylacetate-coenzyme A ligase PaaK-like adenylate-forming protein
MSSNLGHAVTLKPGRIYNSSSWRKFADVLRALSLERRLYDPVLRWSPEQLRGHQERSWRHLAQYAAAHSPFYREHYKGIDLARVSLSSLPPVAKHQLMERFDEAVTDPALKLRDIESFLARASPDDRFRDRFHILQTSGSTGQRGLIVYAHEEWLHTIAAALRSQKLMGQKLRLWPRQRMATFISTNPCHISCRLTRSSDVGLLRRLTIDPQESFDRVVPKLEAFQPETLFGYPAVILALAQTAIDGALRIRPARVIAGGEAVTSILRETVRQAWNCPVLDLYATSETGALAVESPAHQVRYLLEDTTLVEVAHVNDASVPDGEPGHHLLITCLNRVTQPLIRYRLSDRLTLAPPLGEGCPPFRRVRAIEGRVEDALRLKNQLGHEVEFRHPTLVEDLLETTQARQIKVIQDKRGISVHLVAAVAAADRISKAARHWLETTFAQHQLVLPPLNIRVVQRLAGDETTMGKYRPVECRLPRGDETDDSSRSARGRQEHAS